MHDLYPLIAHLLGGAGDKTNPDYCVDRLDKLMLEDGYCLHENVCAWSSTTTLLFMANKTDDLLGGTPGLVENFITISCITANCKGKSQSGLAHKTEPLNMKV